MNHETVVCHKQISRELAKKLYNAENEIVVCTSSVTPSALYGIAIYNIIEEQGYDFDKLIEEFVFYNCNTESGDFPCFYVEE